jgi:hypothetical protein
MAQPDKRTTDEDEVLNFRPQSGALCVSSGARLTDDSEDRFIGSHDYPNKSQSYT